MLYLTSTKVIFMTRDGFYFKKCSYVFHIIISLRLMSFPRRFSWGFLQGFFPILEYLLPLSMTYSVFPHLQKVCLLQRVRPLLFLALQPTSLCFLLGNPPSSSPHKCTIHLAFLFHPYFPFPAIEILYPVLFLSADKNSL